MDRVAVTRPLAIPVTPSTSVELYEGFDTSSDVTRLNNEGCVRSNGASVLQNVLYF